MDKKLLTKYLAVAIGLLILGPLTGVGIVNGYVGFLSLYITVRFIYDGFKFDNLNKNFYVYLLLYLLFVTLFSRQILFGLTDIIQNQTAIFVGQLVLGSLLSALPYVWYLVKVSSRQINQRTRAWYFVVSPLIILPLSLLLAYT